MEISRKDPIICYYENSLEVNVVVNGSWNSQRNFTISDMTPCKQFIEGECDFIDEFTSFFRKGKSISLSDILDWQFLLDHPFNIRIGNEYFPKYWLKITYNNIINVPVGNPNSISDWNTFFNLPTNGDPFTGVFVIGNEVILYGGRHITITTEKFRNNTSMVSIIDSGCIETLGVDCFRASTILEYAHMRGVLNQLGDPSVDYGNFGECLALKVCKLPNLVNAGGGIFYGCQNLEEADISKLEAVGNFTFYFCYKLKKLSLPKLKEFNYFAFAYFNGLEELYIPSLTSATHTGWMTTAFSGTEKGNLNIIGDPSILNLDDIIFYSFFNNLYMNGVLYDPMKSIKAKGDLRITFDTLVGFEQNAWGGTISDRYDINLWNQAFEHRKWSTPFTSVEWNGNTVTLKGGENIFLHYGPAYDDWHITHMTQIIDDGCVVSVGGYGIGYGSEIPIYSFPVVRALGQWAFQDDPHVIAVSFPELLVVDACAFYGVRYTEISCPKLRSIGNATFNLLPNITELHLPSATALSLTPQSPNLFTGTIGRTVRLTIPASMMTINGGNPQASIAYLQANNTETIVQVPDGRGALELHYNDLVTYPPVVNVRSVADWNTKFNLPANGTSFTSVVVAKNTIYLYGGANITIEQQLAYDLNLLKVIDNAHCIIIGLEASFQAMMHEEANITQIYLPKLLSIRPYTFAYQNHIEEIYIPLCRHIGGNDQINSVFNDFSPETTLKLTVPSILMTCNNGGTEGDIFSLQENSSVIVYEDKTLLLSRINYGLLYNWYAVGDPRGLAPVGYHVPTDVEFATLSSFYGGDNVAGGELKAMGVTDWNTPNTGANNNSRFNALPSGSKYHSTGQFVNKGIFTTLWTSISPYSGFNDEAAAVRLEYNSTLFETIESGSTTGGNLRDGHPVRCIRDTIVGWVPGEQVIDYDGNVYDTIKIGSQVWMLQNLAVRHYRNGDLIPEVTSDASWMLLSTGALCAYDNNWGYVFK